MSKKQIKLELYFGALTASVSEQITEQFGIKVSLPAFDKDAKAIVRLYVRGITTDAENHKVRTRLMKKITEYINTYPICGTGE